MASVEQKLATTTFGKTLQDYSIGDLKLTMWIPNDLAGRVIGKKGLVIQNLQREHKLRLINALPRLGESLWIAVVLLGEIKNVFDACKVITDIVEGEVDDVVFEFTINYRKPFFLYGGRKFGIIKRISADTNVRIFFPEFNPKEQAFKEALPVSLEGASADVRRAVGMLEREALIYQHQQALRSERMETNSTSSGESSRHDVKTGRRALLATKPDSGGAQGTPAPRTAPHASAPQQVRSVGKEERGVADPLRPVPAKARNAAPSEVPAEEVGPKATHLPEATLIGTAEDAITAKYGGRQVEEFINVPTSLVGLLLSKRPKAKSTTINMIQVMTHTIISKMLPAGIAEDSSAPEHEHDNEVGGEPDSEPVPVVDDGQRGADGADCGRRRRMASDGDADVDGSGCGEGEDLDSGSGEASESDDDDDQDVKPVKEGPSAWTTAEATTADVAAEGGGVGRDVPADANLVDTTEAAAVDEVKRRAIAESERLGYVVFRVLGFHEENVRAVVRALQDIIDGERIALVCEKLKTASVKLQWPPHRQPPKWARDPAAERREPRARKERSVKPGGDGEGPRPRKARDPLLAPRSSRLRRADGEDDGAAEGEQAEGEVSSRYKGRNPRSRDQLPRGPPRTVEPKLQPATGSVDDVRAPRGNATDA